MRCIVDGCLENDDLENDDVENNDLENDDLSLSFLLFGRLANFDMKSIIL